MRVKVGDHIGSYTFNAAAKTLTFSDIPYSDFDLQHILMVNNTTAGEILYLFDDSTINGTFDTTTNILTMEYDLTGIADDDNLLVYIDIPYGIDDRIEEYDSFVRYHSDINIPQKGSSINVDLHPKISSEGQIIDSDLLYILDSTGTDTGFLQVFRASTNNIHDILMALEGELSISSDILLFDMEYASDNDADNDWNPSSVNDMESRSTNTSYGGNYALRLDIADTNAIGEDCEYRYGSLQDWSSNIGMFFYNRCDRVGINYEMRIVVRDDNKNEMYYDFYATQADTWEKISIDFDNFINYVSVDLSIIDRIRFECRSTTPSGHNTLIDEMYLFGNLSDQISVNVKLYDFGTTAAPTDLSDGTSLVLDDNYVTLDTYAFTLYTQKKPYNLHMHVGSHDMNNSITIGNYYGIYILRPDTGKVKIYGTENQLYLSGNCYTDSTGTLTDQSCSSGFIVLSSIDGNVKSICIRSDMDAGSSYVYILLVDSSNKLKKLIAQTEFMSGETERRIDFDYSKGETLLINSNQHLVCHFLSGLDSIASEVEIEVDYQYNSFNIYG